MGDKIARSPALRKLSIRLNKLVGSGEVRTFCSYQHKRKREGKWNVTLLLDLTLGKDHCLISWVNYKLGAYDGIQTHRSD